MNIEELLTHNKLWLAEEVKDSHKEIERLNNELELQNIEMGREIERLKELWKTDVESSKEILYEKEQEIERLKDRIDRANNFIDQVLLYRIPNKTKEVYEDIETLQNILNGSDKE